MNTEQLKAIRIWAQRGNDAKFACDIEGLLPEELGAWRMLDKHEDSLCELTPAAVMLARSLDALDHANETAEGIAPVDEWLPIESAPKAGHFLIKSGDIICSAYWKRDDYGELYLYESGYYGMPRHAPKPTHWRPLPPPPKATL